MPAVQPGEGAAGGGEKKKEKEKDKEEKVGAIVEEKNSLYQHNLDPSFLPSREPQVHFSNSRG